MTVSELREALARYDDDNAVYMIAPDGQRREIAYTYPLSVKARTVAVNLFFGAQNEELWRAP